jgi:hypothetical protein
MLVLWIEDWPRQSPCTSAPILSLHINPRAPVIKHVSETNRDRHHHKFLKAKVNLIILQH